MSDIVEGYYGTASVKLKNVQILVVIADRRLEDHEREKQKME